MLPDTIFSVLALDAGNTRIKWGVHEGHWIACGAIATSQGAELAQAWASAPPPQRAIACNVAGADVQRQIEAACARTGLALQTIRAEHEQLGVVSSYADPHQLGADRWAAMIAAHHGEPRTHKLVVNVGTALTIDALTAQGKFLGGLILPGPPLMRRSLDRGTANLRLTEGEFHDFPRSTPDAITSGALQAGAGAIARMCDAMARQGCAPDLIVISGGGLADLAPHLPIAFAIHENLVLDGLILIARNA
jgi:type III pantothenate kinase